MIGEAALKAGEYSARNRGELSPPGELVCLTTGDGFILGECLRVSHLIGEDLAMGTGLDLARGAFMNRFTSGEPPHPWWPRRRRLNRFSSSPSPGVAAFGRPNEISRDPIDSMELQRFNFLLLDCEWVVVLCEADVSSLKDTSMQISIGILSHSANVWNVGDGWQRLSCERARSIDLTCDA